jgi:hypothetical protein
MKFEPILHLPNLVTGVWRRFCVHVFDGPLGLEDMDRIEAAGDLWHRKNPGKIVEMVIIFASDARMSGDERARIASIVKRWEDRRTASATVVLASGLMGAMHRSILTGLQMIAPPPHPTKVFGVFPDAVQWLAPHVESLCGVDMAHGEILAGIDDLCATLRPGQTERSAPG